MYLVDLFFSLYILQMRPAFLFILISYVTQACPSLGWSPAAGGNICSTSSYQNVKCRDWLCHTYICSARATPTENMYLQYDCGCIVCPYVALYMYMYMLVFAMLHGNSNGKIWDWA